MLTKVQKWGNSLGLRIPKSFAAEAQLAPGSTVDVTVAGGDLVVRPVRVPKYKLDQLLKGVRPDNLHDEISTGQPVGREVW